MTRTGKKQADEKNKFTKKMQIKLVVLYLFILLAFAGLSARLFFINRDNGDQYKKQVLSQQYYSSRTIPFRRGDILDSKGTRLATSEKVYNVVLDCKQMGEKEECINATVAALVSCFDVSASDIHSYREKNPTSRYYVVKRQQTYEQVAAFEELLQNKENGKNIQGVWFEEEYRRVYPNNTLASDVIGFTTKDNVGKYGLEEYYNDILSGVNGREYGYMNDDSNLERTTKAAVDGYNVVSTLDANIQGIVERHLAAFNEEYKNAVREGNGARNVGCVIMDVNNGNVLAMASYPGFDLNNPKAVEPLIGTNLVNEQGEVQADVITAEKAAELEASIDGEEAVRQLNSLWRNYCIFNTYEPGSTMKPFTVAAALESGSITGNEVYQCNGNLTVVEGQKPVKCHNTFGDGEVSVSQAVEMSCNVALMKIGQAMGKTTMLKYLEDFNFGLKTNIDLSGESRTAGLVYKESNMGPMELATSTFGQGFNVTMIQMITGFCSLINGGYYYEPHMVSRITASDGSVVRNIEPRLLKQTISEETSAKIRDYCLQVVIGEKGTGHTARPAGYLIGGKTGTAETVPRGNKEYVVSFMGYAPADNPQIAIYVVVDRPNAARQDDAKYATRIVRSILTEVLPYLDIFMTEPLSEKEQQELEEQQIAYKQALMNQVSGNSVSGNDVEGAGETQTGQGTETGQGGGTGQGGETGQGTETGQGGGTGQGDGTGQAGEPGEGNGSGRTEEQEGTGRVSKEDMVIDPETGYGILPDGTKVDPATGEPVESVELGLPEPSLPQTPEGGDDSPF